MKGHARNFMTERVTAISPETPLEQIARTMVAGRFGGVPVTGPGDKVLGFVSEGDVAGALMRETNPQTPARTIMTSDPVVVDEFETSDQVIHLMRERKVDHVLVVRERRLVGIITPLDVLRFFVDHVLPVPPEVG